MSAAEKWSKATRLAVAGAVAPALRAKSERTASRRVALVDAEGNVTGYTTIAEVQRGILERAKIELEVTEGVRPKKLVCERCGKLHEPSAKGKIKRKLCPHCHVRACSDCGAELSRTAAFRNKTPRCVQCAGKARSLPPKFCLDCKTVLCESARKRAKTVLCVPCSRVARRKPLPRCAMCEKELSQSARVQPIKYCRSCFRKSPEWLANARAAMERALKVRWVRHRAKATSPKEGTQP